MTIAGDEQPLQSELTDLQLLYYCSLSNRQSYKGLLLLVLLEALRARLREEAERLHVSLGDIDASLRFIKRLAADVFAQLVDDDPTIDLILIHIVRREKQAR